MGNFVTNGNFEVDAAGWNQFGCIFTRSNDVAHTGGFCGKIVPDGVSNDPRAEFTRATVIPLKEYRTKLWLRSPVAIASAGARVNWFTVGGAYLSTGLADVPLVANQWKLQRNVLIAPATAEKADFHVAVAGVAPAGNIVYFDEVDFDDTYTADTSVGSLLTEYFTEHGVLDEFGYFSARSGLTPVSKFSLSDHKLAFYRAQNGTNTGSLVDNEILYWATVDAGNNVGSYTDRARRNYE